MVQRVICIDDDPLCLMLNQMVIKEAKIAKETLLAGGVKEALSLLHTLYPPGKEKEKQIPALIFLDINMPEMNGWDFLNTFEEEFQYLSGIVKVIMLSSSIDPEDVSRSRQYRTVCDFISKPLTVEQINKIQVAA